MNGRLVLFTLKKKSNRLHYKDFIINYIFFGFQSAHLNKLWLKNNWSSTRKMIPYSEVMKINEKE